MPYDSAALVAYFGGLDGIRRIAIRTIELSKADPRIADIFAEHGMARLKRTLGKLFCYLRGAGCEYTGREMRAAYAGLGATKADLNASVDNLQAAMREANVPFAAHDRLLAKLAQMSKNVVERISVSEPVAGLLAVDQEPYDLRRINRGTST